MGRTSDEHVADGVGVAGDEVAGRRRRDVAIATYQPGAAVGSLRALLIDH